MATNILSRKGWFWGRRHPHTRLSETERLDLRYVGRQHMPDQSTNTTRFRSSQRTFDGAYSRTALLQLSFSLTVMRLFQAEFFWVGLACCVLALGLFFSAVLRYRMTLHYEQKVQDVVDMSRSQVNHDTSQPNQSQGQAQDQGTSAAPETEATYSLLPRFSTAGLVVALTTTVTACVEVAIIVLICLM